MLDYLITNKEWIFSGIGVSVVSWVLFRKSAGARQSQKSGDNSTNIQAGGDINFTNSDKDGNDS